MKLLNRFEGNTNRVVYEAWPAGFDAYERLMADETQKRASMLR
jgi:hypothetical protein